MRTSANFNSVLHPPQKGPKTRPNPSSADGSTHMVDKKLNKTQVKKLTNAKQAATPALHALTDLVEKGSDDAMKPHVPQYIVDQARTVQKTMQNMMPHIEMCAMSNYFIW